MTRNVVFLCALLLVGIIPLSSAYTYLTMYVNEAGNVEMIGESNSSISVPAGVMLLNGKVNGTTAALTAKRGEVWTFSYTLKESELKVILPLGAVVKNVSKGEIFIERDHIVVYGHEKLIFSYVLRPTTSSDEPVTKNSRVIFIFLGVFIIIFVSGYVLYLRYFRLKGDAHSLSSLTHLLNDREQLILRQLQRVGKVKSSYLRRVCDIPKASFSRHIHELERKKLVKLSGLGKNKFVEHAKNVE